MPRTPLIPRTKPRERDPTPRGPQVHVQLHRDVPSGEAERLRAMLERLLERTEFSARVSLVYCVEGTAEGKRPRSSYAESLVLDLLMDGKALPLKEVYRRGKEHTVRYLDDIGEPVTRPLPIGKETLRSAWRRYGFTAGRAGFGGEFWLYPPGLQPKGSRGGG